MKSLNSFAELTRLFNNQETCVQYLAWARWRGKPRCPYCDCEKVYHKNDGRYACSHCKNTFSVLVGTVFQNTKLSLVVWFRAIFLVCNSKKGISSCQLSMILGVTQKTAWFMLQKIRIMLKEKSDIFLDVVRGIITERQNKNGALFKIRLTDGSNILHPMLQKFIYPKSRIYIDQRICYQTLSESEKSKYRIEDPYPLGIFKENIENQKIVDGLWQQMKRMVMGVYHYVSSSHFHRYVYEAIFRKRTQDKTNGERFDIAMNRTNLVIPYYLVSPKNTNLN